MSLEDTIKVNNKRKSCLKKEHFVVLFFSSVVISLYLVYDFILLIIILPFIILFLSFEYIFISKYNDFYKMFL